MASKESDTDEYVVLTDRQREILEFIEKTTGERQFPPSVREICTAVGLTSPSTVHSHLRSLERYGYLKRDATKPRAIEVRRDPVTGAHAERAAVRHVPLIGDVAAGTGVIAEQNVEELMPLPAELTGDGELFMLRVRGESMIDAGIYDGDFVVVNRQATATDGDIVIAGIPGDEATVKTFRSSDGVVTLEPSNPTMSPMQFPADEVAVFGRVVTVLRRL